MSSSVGRLIYQAVARTASLGVSAGQADTVAAQVGHLLRRGKVQAADLQAMALLLPMAEAVLTGLMATYRPIKPNQGQYTETSFSFRSSAAPEEVGLSGMVAAAVLGVRFSSQLRELFKWMGS